MTLTTDRSALRTQALVGGVWVEGERRVPVMDPATDEVVAEVEVAGEAVCTAAVDAAEAALPGWAATPPRQRAEVLRRAFEIMTAEAEELARLITRENGKALSDSRAEVAYAAEFFRWFSEECTRVQGDFRTAPQGDKRIIVTHQPVGVSLLITPWNYPAAMATRKIAPALAAGCSVVLKPATETPLTALAVGDVMQRAGAPAGVVNVVVASPAGPLVSGMLHDPRVRNLSFTGSTEVGVHLLREAADQVVRTSMELGGNAPFLVLEGADVDAAVEGAIVAKTRNGGAACTAANRFFVHRSLADDFTDRFSRAMGALRMGPGLDDGVQIASLVSVAERDKVAALVEASYDAGVSASTGGSVPEGRGAFYPPTVLTGVQPDHDLLRHEIFGPVAPIVLVDSDEEAVRLANDTPYGLISYVYAGEMRRGLRVCEALDAGMVALNRGVVSDPAAPFGGFKESGLGREGGFAGIHEFLESKYIATDL